MKQNPALNAFLKSFAILFILSACKNENKEVLRVAVAANARYAMEEMVRAYEAENETHVELVISSSGKLTAQIAAGAPYDVFVSADTLYPQSLYRQGFTQQPSRIYGYGALVLFSTKEEGNISIAELSSPNIQHIALANPESAPYGQAAMEVLRHFDWEQLLSEKLVYGESIAQTTQFILSGAAELGFTAKSVVAAPEMQNIGKWISIPDSLYTPIAQGAIVIDGRKTPHDDALPFYSFLFSEKGNEIWESYGYDVK